MEEHRLARALTAAGVGGAALAAGTLLLAGVYATTPEGSSPTAVLKPCFSSNCSSATTARRALANGTSSSPAAAPASPKSATRPSPAQTQLTSRAPQTWADPVPTLHSGTPVVAMDSVNGGLVMVGSDGGVFPLGRAGFYGSLGGKGIQSRIVAAATDARTGGYWLAGADGSVFSLGAPYYGSLGKSRPAAPVTAMAATASGDGYWLVTSAGGVFSFGAAKFHGSLLGHKVKSKVVDIVATPDGGGYWLVTETGHVFSFGDAGYFGALGSHRPSTPIVAMAATSTGAGYWLISAAGGVFNFGDASFEGNAVNAPRRSPMAAIVATPTNSGYWLVDQDGEVFAYGDAVVVTSTPQAQVRHTANTGTAPHPAAPAPTTGPPPAATAAAAAPAPPAATTAAPAHQPTNLVRYDGGTSGVDISRYQCKNIPASPTAIAVVQVTGGGLDQGPNPCYAQQAAWAGSNLSTYIYMDGVPQPAPASALNGPAGQCTATKFACQSYNYGYNETVYYVSYSRALGIDPKLWWLDVERYSGWGDSGANALTIRGALDALRAEHVHSGVYSSASQWHQITGDMAIPGEAEWVPGAGERTGPGYSATSFCSTPDKYTFGRGRLALVQYGYSGPFPGSYSGPTTYDQDYACS